MTPINDHDNAPVTHPQDMGSAIFPIIQITVLKAAHIGFGKIFLDMTAKTQARKANVNQ